MSRPLRLRPERKLSLSRSAGRHSRRRGRAEDRISGEQAARCFLNRDSCVMRLQAWSARHSRPPDMAAIGDLEKEAIREESGSSPDGGDPGELRDQGVSNNRDDLRPFAWRPVRADNQTTGRCLRRHDSPAPTESRDDDCFAGKGCSHDGGAGGARPIAAWRFRGSGLGGRSRILRAPRSDPPPVHGSDPLSRVLRQGRAAFEERDRESKGDRTPSIPIAGRIQEG
jgi:hypothetical protein